VVGWGVAGLGLFFFVELGCRTHTVIGNLHWEAVEFTRRIENTWKMSLGSLNLPLTGLKERGKNSRKTWEELLILTGEAVLCLPVGDKDHKELQLCSAANCRVVD